MNANTQIDDLVWAFPSCRRVSGSAADGVMAILEIVFEVNGGLKTLRIYLPSTFPSVAPKMQVVGSLSHPWLDSYNRVVGCPALCSWSEYNSVLCVVVQDTLVGLQVGISPMDLAPPAYSAGAYQSTPMDHSSDTRASPNAKTVQMSDKIAMPTIPNEFPELSKLSESQLQRLEHDDVALRAHVDMVSQAPAMIALRDQLMESNARQCEENLSHETELSELRERVSKKKAALQERISEFNIRADIQSSQFTVPPENILSQLTLLINKKDLLAEENARKFVAGHLDLDSFLRDFVTDKAHFYSLSAKMSKPKVVI